LPQRALGLRQNSAAGGILTSLDSSPPSVVKAGFARLSVLLDLFCSTQGARGASWPVGGVQIRQIAPRSVSFPVSLLWLRPLAGMDANWPSRCMDGQQPVRIHHGPGRILAPGLNMTDRCCIRVMYRQLGPDSDYQGAVVPGGLPFNLSVEWLVS